MGCTKSKSYKYYSGKDITFAATEKERLERITSKENIYLIYNFG